MLRLFLIAVLTCISVAVDVHGQRKERATVPKRIPYGVALVPKQQEGIFAVCSKQGMRILVSRDDGKAWKQTFLGTSSEEDGGWHGTFAVYGMAADSGVIGVFSGWGASGVYIGSDDGENWAHLNKQPAKLASAWSAAAGNGVMLTSDSMWGGVTTSSDKFSTWTQHKIKDFLDGDRTHHLVSGFGDFQGGRFVVAGDNNHIFYSEDNGRTWNHSRTPKEAGEKNQEVVIFGNEVFLVKYKDHIARSADGGKTWTLHDPGLKGWGSSWRGLSFVRGEFWLTAKKGSHARKSKDGIHWVDLPKSTPGGRFAESSRGTLINVERGRYDIKRSEDGTAWESVFVSPEENVTWDTAFAVFEKVNQVD